MFLEPSDNISSDLCFSSEIHNLKFRTDEKGPITFAIWTRPFHDTVVSGTVYAFENKVTVYDVREAVEEYMKEKQLTLLQFVVELENDDSSLHFEHTLLCLYSPLIQRYSAAFYVHNFFLTTLNVRPMNTFLGEEQLFYYATKGEVLNYSCELLYRKKGDDKITRVKDSKTLSPPSQNGIDLLYVGYQDLEATFGLQRGDVVLSVIYSLGNRTCTYYGCDTGVDVAFHFLNVFNLWEGCGLHANCTTKLETDFSTALCDGVTSLYNIEHAKSFDVETEPLTIDQAQWLEQLLTSPYVRKGNDKVLIMDYTFELNEKDDKPIVVKFRWEYADKRLMHAQQSKLNYEGFFTDEFMKQFN